MRPSSAHKPIALPPLRRLPPKRRARAASSLRLLAPYRCLPLSNHCLASLEPQHFSPWESDHLTSIDVENSIALPPQDYSEAAALAMALINSVMSEYGERVHPDDAARQAAHILSSGTELEPESEGSNSEADALRLGMAFIEAVTGDVDVMSDVEGQFHQQACNADNHAAASSAQPKRKKEPSPVGTAVGAPRQEPKRRGGVAPEMGETVQLPPSASQLTAVGEPMEIGDNREPAANVNAASGTNGAPPPSTASAATSGTDASSRTAPPEAARGRPAPLGATLPRSTPSGPVRPGSTVGGSAASAGSPPASSAGSAAAFAADGAPPASSASSANGSPKPSWGAAEMSSPRTGEQTPPSGAGRRTRTSVTELEEQLEAANSVRRQLEAALRETEQSLSASQQEVMRLASGQGESDDDMQSVSSAGSRPSSVGDSSDGEGSEGADNLHAATAPAGGRTVFDVMMKNQAERAQEDAARAAALAAKQAEKAARRKAVADLHLPTEQQPTSSTVDWDAARFMAAEKKTQERRNVQIDNSEMPPRVAKPRKGRHGWRHNSRQVSQ